MATSLIKPSTMTHGGFAPVFGNYLSDPTSSDIFPCDGVKVCLLIAHYLPGPATGHLFLWSKAFCDSPSGLGTITEAALHFVYSDFMLGYRKVGCRLESHPVWYPHSQDSPCTNLALFQSPLWVFIYLLTSLGDFNGFQVLNPLSFFRSVVSVEAIPHGCSSDVSSLALPSMGQILISTVLLSALENCKMGGKQTRITWSLLLICLALCVKLRTEAEPSHCEARVSPVVRHHHLLGLARQSCSCCPDWPWISYLPQVGLYFVILLPLPLDCWDYRVCHPDC